MSESVLIAAVCLCVCLCLLDKPVSPLRQHPWEKAHPSEPSRPRTPSGITLVSYRYVSSLANKTNYAD